MVSRQKIDSAEGLYDMPEEEFEMNDLSCLSIGELHNLYRQWPKHHQARANAGRESHTFYYKGKNRSWAPKSKDRQQGRTA